MKNRTQTLTDMPLIAGLDIGATNIKAIIFAPNGSTVAEASVPTPTHYPRPGWAYYQPEEMWQATATALRQATGQIEKSQRIAGVAVASMGEAAVPLDGQGQPTYDSIAWFDQRTQPQAEWLDQKIGAEPHLRFSNPPHNDPKSRGAFIGLSTDAKRGTLFRAILEGLAYESRCTLEGAAAYDQVMAPDQIYAIGGSTRNQLLMQIKASVLNQRINVVEAAEATCLGAAILGGLGAKVYPDVSAALAQIEYTQTAVEPRPDHAVFYDRYFKEVYRHLYASLRALNHATHKIMS